jgi:hypothetical protein
LKEAHGVEETKEYPYTPEHVHDYYGRTSVDMDHFHTFIGSTAVQTYVAGGHVHNYANETRVAMDHIHLMNGTTGTQVPVLMGHVHQMAGTTNVQSNHSHTYDVYTGYQRSPRNVRRPRLFQATSAGDKAESGAAPERKRPRLRLPFRNPSSGQK